SSAPTNAGDAAPGGHGGIRRVATAVAIAAACRWAEAAVSSENGAIPPSWWQLVQRLARIGATSRWKLGAFVPCASVGAPPRTPMPTTTQSPAAASSHRPFPLVWRSSPIALLIEVKQTPLQAGTPPTARPFPTGLARRDVLVQPEEVVGVVAPLERLEAVVLLG